jgi:hypothetical protein
MDRQDDDIILCGQRIRPYLLGMSGVSDAEAEAIDHRLSEVLNRQIESDAQHHLVAAQIRAILDEQLGTRRFLDSFLNERHRGGGGDPGRFGHETAIGDNSPG